MNGNDGRKIILSKKKAQELRDYLKSDYPEISAEIDRALQSTGIKLEKIRNQIECKHEWHSFSKEELKKIGSPEAFGFKDGNIDHFYELVMRLFGFCEKCGLKYRYSCIPTEQMEEIYAEYESNAIISLEAHSSNYAKLFEDAYKRRMDDLKGDSNQKQC